MLIIPVIFTSHFTLYMTSRRDRVTPIAVQFRWSSSFNLFFTVLPLKINTNSSSLLFTQHIYFVFPLAAEVDVWIENTALPDEATHWLCHFS